MRACEFSPSRCYRRAARYGAAATAQGALRHSNVQTTLAHYTKTVRTDVRQTPEKRAKTCNLKVFGTTNGHFRRPPHPAEDG